jgi:hypothetical protein
MYCEIVVVDVAISGCEITARYIKLPIALE